MSKTPVSKSQARILRLIGQQADNYREAATFLEAAGYECHGIPTGETWRSVAKLSDAEVLAKLVRTEGPGRQMSAIDIIEVGY